MTIEVAGRKMFDNTRLSEYKRCPRRYYYRHVLDWVPNGKTPPALVFGSGWHNGMDVLWSMYKTGGYSVEDMASAALSAFVDTWTEEGYPADDDPFGVDMSEYEPRTPMNAYQMFFNYIEARGPFMDQCELLSVERPFVVPLSPDLSSLYIGKLDKIVRFEGKISAVEHKSTTAYRKATGVSQSFLESFSPNSQVDGYFHALRMLHGTEAKAIFADVALVHKHVHDAFALQPVRKQSEALGEWLDDTNYWIEKVLNSEAEGRWPKNTNSCFDFNQTCPYADLCRGFHFHTIEDRVKDLDEGDALQGFKVEQWDPVKELRINVENLDQYLIAKG